MGEVRRNDTRGVGEVRLVRPEMTEERQTRVDDVPKTYTKRDVVLLGKEEETGVTKDEEKSRFSLWGKGLF